MFAALGQPLIALAMEGFTVNGRTVKETPSALPSLKNPNSSISLLWFWQSIHKTDRTMVEKAIMLRISSNYCLNRNS